MFEMPALGLKAASETTLSMKKSMADLCHQRRKSEVTPSIAYTSSRTTTSIVWEGAVYAVQ